MILSSVVKLYKIGVNPIILKFSFLENIMVESEILCVSTIV